VSKFIIFTRQSLILGNDPLARIDTVLLIELNFPGFIEINDFPRNSRG